jgi:hypothetical protein
MGRTDQFGREWVIHLIRPAERTPTVLTVPPLPRQRQILVRDYPEPLPRHRSRTTRRSLGLLTAAATMAATAAVISAPVAAAAPAPTTCAPTVAAVNGSFETPVIPSNTWELHSDVPGWHTTNADGLIEIWANPFMGVTPAQGAQLAEIQGNARDSLYQVVDTTPGQTIHWSLAHQGREGDDTMTLSVGQDGGALVGQGTWTDPKGSWTVHTGDYTVPAGQTSTRFSFDAGPSAGGSESVGNLLDAVSFTTDACAADDTGTTAMNTPLVVAAPGVLANDSGTGITASVGTLPLHGTVSLAADGSYTYTPADGYVGTDSFTYTATASNGSTAIATVAITVTAPGTVNGCGSAWQFNGSAALVSSCQLLLTPTATKLAGTAFYPVAQPSSKIAKITYDTTMGGGTGADGIGLMFANPTAGATPTALGGTGGFMGLNGIPGNVVTLDTYKNSGDPSANFVGLCTTNVTTGYVPGLKCTNTANVAFPLRGALVLDAAATHHVVVTTAILSGKTIVKSVTVDGNAIITNGLMQLSPTVLIGFGSATGTSTDTHIVSNISVTYRP